MDGSSVLLAAHRGDKKNYPENTMPAFEAALRAGVDMIETDIRITSDGELILIHDRNALRTTGFDGFVIEMTLAQIKALDAGSFLSEEFIHTRIPTVREFLEWIAPTQLLVNWELKDYPYELGDAVAFACADKLISLIREYGMDQRSMINSFSNRLLEHIRQQWGHTFPIHGQGIHHCRRAKDTSIMEEKDLFDWCCLYPEESGKSPVHYRENFDYCLEHGILPCVCITDTLEDYQKAIQYGCKMFTSNDIYAATEILRALGAR